MIWKISVFYRWKPISTTKSVTNHVTWSMFLWTYGESKLMFPVLIRTRLQIYFSRTRKVFLLLCSIILSQWLFHWPTWKIDLIKHNSPGLTTHVYANVGNFRLSRASFDHQNHLRWLVNWLMVFYVNQSTFGKPRVSKILDLGPIEIIITVDSRLSLRNGLSVREIKRTM